MRAEYIIAESERSNRRSLLHYHKRAAEKRAAPKSAYTPHQAGHAGFYRGAR